MRNRQDKGKSVIRLLLFGCIFPFGAFTADRTVEMTPIEISTTQGPVRVTVSDAPFVANYFLSFTVTVTNNTTVDIGKSFLVPEYKLRNGTSVMGNNSTGRIAILELKQKESLPFHVVQDVPFSLSDISSSVWKPNINAKLRFQFVSDLVSKSVGKISVAAKLERDSIALKITNDSEDPLEIVWGETSIINLNRTAGSVLHKGVKLIDSDKPQPNTTVPPNAIVEDFIFPTENSVFVPATKDVNGHWDRDPILLDAWPIDKLNLVKELVGKKVGVFLQLMVGGKKVPISLQFELSGISTGQLHWPSQSEVASAPQ